MIKIFLVIALICIAGYLTYDSVSSDLSQKQAVQNYCMHNCNYRSDSAFWEFSSDDGVKGFTTKDECLVYCKKSKMGFAYVIEEYSVAFLSNISNWFK